MFENLSPIEHNQERILTTRQLAESYDVSANIIINNFNRNKDKFIESKHYFFLAGEELKRFKMTISNCDEHLRKTSMLYLWTQRGVLLHAKSVGTDIAWQVTEYLIDDYFVCKQPQLPSNIVQLEQGKLAQQKADTFLKVAAEYSGTYREILQAYALQSLTGEFVLPLPKLERKTYSATEIGDMLGISANMVGKLANRMGLKNEEHGQWFKDKSKYSSREVEVFRYYDNAADLIANRLSEVN